MAGQKITEKEIVTVNSDASILITQQTTEGGVQKERVKRATLEDLLAALEALDIKAKSAKDAGVQLYYDETEQALFLLNAEGEECGDGIPLDVSGGGLAFDGGYIADDGKLHLTLNGTDIAGFDPFYVGSGGSGGGSASGSTITITNRMETRSFAISDSSTSCQILFSAVSIDTETEDPTGNLTANWYVNGNRVFILQFYFVSFCTVLSTIIPKNFVALLFCQCYTQASGVIHP